MYANQVAVIFATPGAWVRYRFSSPDDFSTVFLSGFDNCWLNESLDSWEGWELLVQNCTFWVMKTSIKNHCYLFRYIIAKTDDISFFLR